MKKIFIIIFLLSLFNYINLSCYDDSDDDNVSKDACLKRKPEGFETTKVGDYTPDTCCYEEGSAKCNGKKETYKECVAYDKKNLKKYLDYLEELSKTLKNDDDDDKCEYSKPDINCSSYYLKLGFALLLYLF
jgi:hypothetical protein